MAMSMWQRFSLFYFHRVAAKTTIIRRLRVHFEFPFAVLWCVTLLRPFSRPKTNYLWTKPPWKCSCLWSILNLIFIPFSSWHIWLIDLGGCWMLNTFCLYVFSLWDDMNRSLLRLTTLLVESKDSMLGLMRNSTGYKSIIEHLDRIYEQKYALQSQICCLLMYDNMMYSLTFYCFYFFLSEYHDLIELGRAIVRHNTQKPNIPQIVKCLGTLYRNEKSLWVENWRERSLNHRIVLITVVLFQLTAYRCPCNSN